MSKNSYLEKQARTQQNWLDVGEELGMQKMWDYVQLALRDPDVVGKDTFGKERMQKMFAKLTEIASEYHTAFTADPEADYWQEQLDRRLREVWGDDLQTFFERYPYVKKMGYDRPRKEWRG